MTEKSLHLQPIAEIYDEWEASGQTIAEFSREKGVNPDRLYYRRNYISSNKKPSKSKAGKSISSSKFIPLITATQTSTPITVSVGQVDVAFNFDTDDQLFLKLMRLLKEAL